MSRVYMGRLALDDPLHAYLAHDIAPQLAGPACGSSYRVFKLNGSNDVYLYENRDSGARVIGKFFLSLRKSNAVKAAAHLTHEFDNLSLMRDYGLTGYPHLVARPLGRNYAMNALLVTEDCAGTLLSAVILDAIASGQYAELYAKLTALAYFLAAFHNRSATGVTVDFNEDCAYMDTLTDRLLRIGAIARDRASELNGLRDAWRREPRMWEDRQVMVHGDATPENFMFGKNLAVMTFDLERAHRDDRVFDTGRIAGELKHFFMRAGFKRNAAEPFIGHFLWEYACHFPDRDRAFAAITGRTPFYMGLTLLRIARNGWIDEAYRQRLIGEALQCLRSD